MARTDGDSWNLTTSVGAMATMAAAQRALATSGPHPLVDDPFAAPLVRAVGVDFCTRLVDGQIPNPEPQRMAQRVAVRTRFYDQFFSDATEKGIRQAVILAAGLDARAYRLPWPTGTVVYEVDVPQVTEFKNSTLQSLGAEPTVERRTVAVDLRDDWPAALWAAGFDPDAAAAWSAEGLLIYLPPDAQDALFDRITAFSGTGSQLAAEFVPDTAIFADGSLQRFDQQMRQLGFDTDFSQLVRQGEPSHIIEYLTGRGWQVSPRTVGEQYAANGFDYPDDRAAALFANVTYLSAVLAR
jgi:methyltransferase (TIGR00027 family)